MIKLAQRPEIIAMILLCVAFFAGAGMSPYFLDLRYLLDSTSLDMEIGLLALAMTFIIISGNIDLSVASGLALVACASAWLARHMGMGIVIPFAIVFGIVLGLFNGWLIARLKLPSLTVTLGTLALYRGLAQVIAGAEAMKSFPEWFVGLDRWRIGGLVPVPLIIFLVAATILSLVLHGTTFGRRLYATGTNESATEFSGIRTDRVKLATFALSGLMMGIGALMTTSRLGMAQYNIGAGDELAVITVAVLGGADIFGGRGTIFGSVIALFLLGFLRRGMDLRNIEPQNQMSITGALLVLSVVLANLTARLNKRTESSPPSAPIPLPAPTP
jgi:rhamnose transport system permease protein